nr:uncharacterized protein LOC111426034 [Onthophagus taurus]
MYKMYSVVIFVSLSLFLDFGGAQSGKCNNPPPSDNFNEDDCAKTRYFYVYAASIPCENCCILRELHQKSPGVLETKEFNRKGQEPAVNQTIKMIKQGKSPFYKIKDKNGKYLTFYLVNGTDCGEKSFLYTKWDKVLYVYTSNPNQEPDFLNTLQKMTLDIKGCDVKLYPYNPKDNCK